MQLPVARNCVTFRVLPYGVQDSMCPATSASLRSWVPLGCTQLPRIPAACVSMEGQKSEKAVALETLLAAVTQLVCITLLPPEPAVLQGVVSPRQGRPGPRGTRHLLPTIGAAAVRMEGCGWAVLGWCPACVWSQRCVRHARDLGRWCQPL